MLAETVKHPFLVYADPFVLELAHFHQQLQDFLSLLRVLAELVHKKVNQVVVARDIEFPV